MKSLLFLLLLSAIFLRITTSSQADEIYVLTANVIVKFLPDGSATVFADKTKAKNALLGLARDPAGNFYTLSGNQIQKITPEGIFPIFSFSNTSANTTLNSIACDGAGNLYALIVELDFMTHGPKTVTIHKLDANGSDSIFANITQFGGREITCDHDGNVYTLEKDGIIAKYTPNGVRTVLIKSYTPNGVRTGFKKPVRDGPYHLAFDSRNNLFAIGADTIYKSESGGPLAVFAKVLRKRWDLFTLSIDSADNVYVTQGNAEVIKFKPDGSRSAFGKLPFKPDGYAPVWIAIKADASAKP